MTARSLLNTKLVDLLREKTCNEPGHALLQLYAKEKYSGLLKYVAGHSKLETGLR